MSSAEHFDVAVVGGGPAGHAAAMQAGAGGARVALIEAEQLGGQCVHATCIPSTILTSATATYVDVQELAVLGVLDSSDRFNLGRAAARRESLVRVLVSALGAGLRSVGVETFQGRGVIDGGHVVVAGEVRLAWDHLVLATGSRWEAPAVAGFPASRVMTPDGVHGLERAPKAATVVAGGTARTAFSLESAAILAVLGSEVTLAAPGDRILSWMDEPIDGAARAAFEAFGIEVVTGRGLDELDGGPDQLLVMPDRRAPFSEGLGLETLGLPVAGGLATDAFGRTPVDRVYAVGDLAGGDFLTQAAIQGGRAAGGAITGCLEPTVASPRPHVLHLPEMAWVGLGAEEAAALGWDVVVGYVDLTFTAAAIAAGGRSGVLEVVVDRELGGLLGVQVVGHGAAELAQLAAAVMQMEMGAADVAALSLWHPSAGEALVDAARSAERQRR